MFSVMLLCHGLCHVNGTLWIVPHINFNDKTFMHYVRMICKGQTFAEYKLYSDALEHICRKNKRLLWYNWWQASRHHLVPALHGLGSTGSNWADLMLMRHTKVWLPVAVEDIVDFIVQGKNYLSFVSNTGKTIRKGPTSYAKKMKERREQRRYIESACDALLTTDMQGEVDKHTNPDSQFQPSCAAKHRVPKKFSTKNPMQNYKNPGLPIQERTLPEEVPLDEEDENEADISSQSDHDDDYHPHLVGNEMEMKWKIFPKISVKIHMIALHLMIKLSWHKNLRNQLMSVMRSKIGEYMARRIISMNQKTSSYYTYIYIQSTTICDYEQTE